MTDHALAHPFSETQWHRLHSLLDELDGRQALWLSGYLAGQSTDFMATSQPADKRPAVLIAYATETDNSRLLAQRFGEQCREAGVVADVQDLARVRPRQLAKQGALVVITATHGDGDPPEPALPFFEAMMDDDTAPNIKNLGFAVLALGDSTYQHFCTAGRQLDARLEALGGERVLERQECDVDFHAPAQAWLNRLLDKLPKPASGTTPSAPAITSRSTPSHDKQHPLRTEVLVNQRLSAPGRTSPIHHLELALEVPDFPVVPGDAVGVLADNPPDLVAAVLDATGLNGELPVSVNGTPQSLVQALRQHRDLTIPGGRFLDYWAELSGHATLKEAVNGGTRTQRALLKRHQVLDLVRDYPARPDAETLVATMRPLQPRLYDLANSLSSFDDELHLTVKRFHYGFNKRRETGIASRYLLELQPGDSVRLYPHRNPRFHLPDDPEIPLVLIAEGTGIAPYRAFLQHRAANGQHTPFWLVFAEQRFEDDFLYQLAFQEARDNGLLARVDTVFHIDQPHRALADPLIEQIDQLAEWLERGAHLYFCGDKDSLTRTEAALRENIDAHLGAGHWKQLSKAKRLHRNLY